MQSQKAGITASYRKLVFRTRLEVTTEEILNDRGDLIDVSFEGEVARIVKMHFSVGVVALECLGAGRQKERVIRAPRRQ